MLYLTVTGQMLKCVGKPHIVADSVNYLACDVRFSGEWADLHAFARFVSPDGDVIVCEIDDGRIDRTAGLNLGEGTWSLMIHGDAYVSGELTERITTNEIKLDVKRSGYTDGDEWDIDIDAGTQIIAKAYAQADRAKSEADRAAGYAASVPSAVTAANTAAASANSAAASATSAATSANSAASSATSAATSANTAATSANTAATSANNAADRALNAISHAQIATKNANDAATAIEAAKERGDFDGADGEDWIPTESELDGIAQSAAGKLQPTISALSDNVDSATEHIADSSVHVTSSDKANWNAKADASDIPNVPVKEVQVAGTALTPDANGAVNVPNAGNGTCGVMRVSNYDSSTGINYTDYLRINPAPTSRIDSRSGNMAMTPTNLNYAVKAALTDSNHLTMTDVEKRQCCDTIGAVREWITRLDTTLTEATSDLGRISFDNPVEIAVYVQTTASTTTGNVIVRYYGGSGSQVGSSTLNTITTSVRSNFAKRVRIASGLYQKELYNQSGAGYTVYYQFESDDIYAIKVDSTVPIPAGSRIIIKYKEV